MVSLVRTTHCFLEAPGILSLSLSCLMWFVQLSDDELLATAGACLSFHTGEGDYLSALEANRPKAAGV